MLIFGMVQEIDDQIKEPAPRVFPKNEDPSLVKRNRRMLGQLLGTLEVLYISVNIILLG